MSAKRKPRKVEKRSAPRYSSAPCPSGKRGYVTKAEARQVARTLRKQGDERLMSPYRCEHCGLVHIGHLPAAVRAGEVTRGEYYSGEAA